MDLCLNTCLFVFECTGMTPPYQNLLGNLTENERKNEPRYEISNNVVSATSKASDQPAHTRSLIRAFASRLNIL